MRFPSCEPTVGESIASRVKDEARVWTALSHLMDDVGAPDVGLRRGLRREGLFYGIAHLSAGLHAIKREALFLEMHPKDEGSLDELSERLTELGVHAITMAVYVEGGRDGTEEGDGNQAQTLPTTKKEHREPSPGNSHAP